MIFFDRGVRRFSHRVVGVCVDDGHVLLHRAESDDFWSLPGGRVELMEPSAAALRREFREELGVDVAIRRLLWVVENFFGTAPAEVHELGLYYLVALVDRPDLGDKLASIHGIEDVGPAVSAPLIFRWFPLDALSSLRLYPTFLREGLRSLPETIQHVVHRDE